MTKTDYSVRIILLLIAAGILTALILTSCNPVKRVISNPKHYKTITDHVISSGACVNDTITISESDTLITFDTLFAIDFQTDTMTVDREIVRTNIVTKTVKIRDTVTKVITDRAKENLLQNKVIDKTAELLKKVEELEKSQAETKQARKDRNKWRLWFFLLLGAFGVYLFRKPLLKLIKPILI